MVLRAAVGIVSNDFLEIPFSSPWPHRMAGVGGGSETELAGAVFVGGLQNVAWASCPCPSAGRLRRNGGNPDLLIEGEREERDGLSGGSGVQSRHMGWKPMLHANSKGQVIWWGNLSPGFSFTRCRAHLSTALGLSIRASCDEILDHLTTELAELLEATAVVVAEFVVVEAEEA